MARTIIQADKCLRDESCWMSRRNLLSAPANAVAGRWRGIVLRSLAPSALWSDTQRVALLRTAGIRVHLGTRIEARQTIVNNRIEIGARVYINKGCMFDPGDSVITVGDDVSIGPDVILACTAHNIGPRSRRARGFTSAPILIGAGTWIGAGAIILQGVTIEPGCVIGAGAVIRQDCHADGLYVGIPGRRVRTLDPNYS